MVTKMPELDSATEKMLLDVAIEASEQGVDEFASPEVFFQGDALNPHKMAVTRTQGDKIKVYSTETGDASEILAYMLRKQMEKRLPNGDRAFSLRPTKTVRKGKITCLFHPLHKDRARLAALGLDHVACPKSNLRSQFDLRMHLEHRHRDEYASVKEDQARQEKEEERRFLRTQMAVLTGKPIPEELDTTEYEVEKPKIIRKRSTPVIKSMRMDDNEKAAFAVRMAEARRQARIRKMQAQEGSAQGE